MDFQRYFGWHMVWAMAVLAIVFKIAGLIKISAFLALAGVVVILYVLRKQGAKKIAIGVALFLFITIALPAVTRHWLGEYPMTKTATEQAMVKADAETARQISQAPQTVSSAVRKTASWLDGTKSLLATLFAVALLLLAGYWLAYKKLGWAATSGTVIWSTIIILLVAAVLWWQWGLVDPDSIPDVSVSLPSPDSCNNWLNGLHPSFKVMGAGLVIIILGSLFILAHRGMGILLAGVGVILLAWGILGFFQVTQLPTASAFSGAPGQKATAKVPAGSVNRTIALSPGQWSPPVYDPPGAAYKSNFRGPRGTRVKFADGAIKPVGGGANYNHPMPMRFFNPRGGEVEVIFCPL